MQPGSLSQSLDRSAPTLAPDPIPPRDTTLLDFFGTLIALLTLAFPLLLISQPSTPTQTSTAHTSTTQPATAPTLVHPIAKVSTPPVQD